jgi:hypothetical protein
MSAIGGEIYGRIDVLDHGVGELVRRRLFIPSLERVVERVAWQVGERVRERVRARIQDPIIAAVENRSEPL